MTNPKPENLIAAWNRWIECYKTLNWNNRNARNVPITMRGYCQFEMDSLSGSEQKKIVKAIEQGYTTATSPMWVKALNFIMDGRDFQVSYLGKSRARIWFPDHAAASRASKLMEAQLTMTGAFKPQYLRLRDNWVTVDLYTGLNKSNFNSLKVLVEQLYEPYAAQREAFAREVGTPGFTVRRVFDSLIDGGRY